MAGKTDKAFNKEQLQELSGAIKALVNNSQTTLDNVQKTFAILAGDTVIGDSQQKDSIMEVVKTTEKTFKELIEKFVRMNATVDAIGEKLGVAISANIRTIEDASNAINSQAKKVKEATGANA